MNPMVPGLVLGQLQGAWYQVPLSGRTVRVRRIDTNEDGTEETMADLYRFLECSEEELPPPHFLTLQLETSTMISGTPKEMLDLFEYFRQQSATSQVLFYQDWLLQREYIRDQQTVVGYRRDRGDITIVDLTTALIYNLTYHFPPQRPEKQDDKKHERLFKEACRRMQGMS